MEPTSNNAEPTLGSIYGGKYRIIEKLGSGGMGGVYKAEHLLMSRTVAVKVLRSNFRDDEVLLKRFHHEAKAASQISHPNAVTLFDYGVEDGNPYLVMEYIEGSTLKVLIAESKPIPPERVARIVTQVCAALHEAHQAGIIHRDIKPDNFMVRRGANGEDIVKVLDFGVSKSVGAGELGSDSELTQAGTIIGTPQYISPEQCQGKDLDIRCDIYALGVVVYEMLTGDVPFRAPSVLELLVKVLHHPTAPLRQARPDLNFSPALDAVVMKCLEKNRDNRYASIDEVGKAFNKAVFGEEKPPRPRRHWVEAAVLGLLIGLLGFVFFRPPEKVLKPADQKRLDALSVSVREAEKEKAEALARVSALKKQADELLQKNDTEKAKAIQEQQAIAERVEKERDDALKAALASQLDAEMTLKKLQRSADESQEALKREQELAKKAEQEKLAAIKQAEAMKLEAERQTLEAKRIEEANQELIKAQEEISKKAEAEKEEALRQAEEARAEAAKLTEMAKKAEQDKTDALAKMEAAKKDAAQQTNPSTVKTVIVEKRNNAELNEVIRKANEQKQEALKRADDMKREANRQAEAARRAENEARRIRDEADRLARQTAAENAKIKVAPPPSEEEAPKQRRRCGPTWCL